jgi:hypothetical protein
MLGRRVTMRSICASSSPPTLGSICTEPGQVEWRSVPTNCAQRPSAHTASVSEGDIVTMRDTGCVPCATAKPDSSPKVASDDTMGSMRRAEREVTSVGAIVSSLRCRVEREHRL